MSRESDTDGEPTPNRRRVLKAGMVAGGIAGLSSATVVATDDTVEVPIAKSGDEVAVTREMPTARWEHLTTSRTVADDVRDRVGSHAAVQSVGRRVSSERLAGGNKIEVVVYVEDTSVDLGLPDAVDGVSIGTDRAREALPTCDGNATFDPVPGGVHIDSNDVTNGDGGTTGCRVTDDGTPYMLTALHVLDDNEDCWADTTAYQWGVEVGEPNNALSNSNLDYALVSEDNFSGIAYSQYVRYDKSGTETEYEVGGRVTNYDAVASDGDTIYRTGRRTDTTTGKVAEVDYGPSSTCADLSASEGIAIDNKHANGDSGSSSWILEQDEAYIVNLCNFDYKYTFEEETCDQTFTTLDGGAGPKADVIANDAGIKFG